MCVCVCVCACVRACVRACMCDREKGNRLITDNPEMDRMESFVEPNFLLSLFQ